MPEIELEKIGIRIVDVPAKAVHSHGSGDVQSIKSVILELTTKCGITGWGEASPWPVFTGTAEANAAAINTYLRPLLIGANPFNVNWIMSEADNRIVGCPEAKAAVEMALLDIQGRFLGVSISDLLGGACRKKLPLSFSVANPDFNEDRSLLETLTSEGIRIFKLKTGFAEHEFDLKRLETLRNDYGSSLDLRVDYNQGMKPYEAMKRLRDLESFSLTFIEQPVQRHYREAMAEFTRNLDTPIMADESVFSPREAIQCTVNQTADIISLKIIKNGGIAKSLSIAAIAKSAGLGVYGGCMFETGIAHAAGAHMNAVIPENELGCEFYMSNYYLREDILAEPFKIEKGLFCIPQGPGLGIDIDRSKLEKYSIERVSEL